MKMDSETPFFAQAIPGFSGGRVTFSPERLRIGAKQEADFAHPTASAFSILDEHCLVTCPRGVHTRIFAALRRRVEVADFDVSEYGVEASPNLGEAEITWFQGIWTGEMGALRERTLSGRIWQNITLGTIQASVLSFWVDRVMVPEAVLNCVVARMAPRGVVLVEFMDSECSISVRLHG